MKKIKLSSRVNQGLYAWVDDEDFDAASKFQWNPTPKGYAIRTDRSGGRKTTVYLHRMIAERMGIGDAEQIDHIDGDKLDNRRCNLRPATNQSNQANVQVQRNNTSGFKGVRQYKTKYGVMRYVARIGVGYKRVHLGCFDTPEQASEAYQEASKEFFGEYAQA